jgi:uroporphyrinogen decarboxylase
MTQHRYLKALNREPVDKTPVWMMRQAGRYLPEYKRVRQVAGSFLDLCKNPELACEVTLQPLARFPLDAAIIFSDILTIPDAMGLGLYFVEGEGPRFKQPIRTLSDIEKLYVPDMDTELRYVMDAVSLTKKTLADKVPLIGFSGSPWTLATYMIEGGPSKTFSIIKKMLFFAPEMLHKMLSILAVTVSDYLNAQAAAGADALMIFDTWGGILTPRDYQLFSLQYMAQIVKVVKQKNPHIPITLFTKNGGQWLEKMAETGCDALGIDWMTDLSDARKRLGDKMALQGNMDPAVLYARPERIREEVKLILQSHGAGVGHIFNLGHGIQLDTPIENVAVFVDAVHEGI